MYSKNRKNSNKPLWIVAVFAITLLNFKTPNLVYSSFNYFQFNSSISIFLLNLVKKFKIPLFFL